MGSALVTGAASGIGRAAARDLAAAGHRVAVCDLDAAGAERVAAELEGAFPVAADIGDPTACRAAVDATIAETGRIDVLVNNAGLQKVAPIEEFPEESWDTLLAVILSGAFHTIKRAFPKMVEQGFGRIVNVSSILGEIGEPYKAAYVAAKHGLVGLTKVVALEGAERGITCNAVLPAFVRTPWIERTAGELARSHGIDVDEVERELILKQAVIKRLSEPEEVARVVAFLCLPESSFITGAMVPVDGGFGAK